jgi:ubiquinone/menaquinone biosynthesis C-methylase UbiE
MNAHESDVARHYDRPGLIDAIREGLKAAGADPDRPRPEDLAPVDEFHTAGRITTLEALSMMPLRPGMRVLDAGCGIGGTSRHLAHEHGCRVTGLDLTPAYVEAARTLSEMTGLSDACDFVEGSVLEMPFDDGDFDAGVTFHVAMNIADREGFYTEAARVLKPGAAFCVFDVMADTGADLAYPVPWAETQATSFLKTPNETRALLEGAGFTVTSAKSLREFAMEFFRGVFEKAAASGPPPLGLHLLTGANTPEKFGNYAQGLAARAIEPVIMVAERR